MIISGVLPLLMVILPKLIIDAVSLKDYDYLVQVMIVFAVLITFLSTISNFIFTYLRAQGLAGRMNQTKLFNKKLKSIPFSFLESAQFQSEKKAAQATLTMGSSGFEGTFDDVSRILPKIISIIGFSIILGLFNVYIIPITIVVCFIQYRISLRGSKYALARNDELQEEKRKADYFIEVSTDFSYGKDIRVEQIEGQIINRLSKQNKRVMKVFKEISFFKYRMNLFDIVFIISINGLIYYLVVVAYFSNQITVGTVAMTIWTILAITLDLQFVFKNLAKLQEDTNYTDKFLQFLDKDFSNETWGSKQINTSDISIEFKDVYFKYPNSEEYVLKGLNFKIKAKGVMALVGINGAGKTTIVKLLCGFYQPLKGNILINGVDMKEYDIFSYREKLAIVFQDVNIYAASVLENITGPNPSDKDIDRAKTSLEKVGLLDKVLSYPNGFQQSLLKVIDETGTDLSGGEAQRLSIARAIYKQNTNIIILDEPTASLDAASEREIYNNFYQLIDDRTSIVISHRLASTRFCDSILFLENGKAIESGTHEQLMNIEHGKYREMFVTQGKYYQEENNDEL
ncbi:MAG: ABC transporter ATP-binding protein [Bacilli bacterium]|nr:ABC transporter ATP-binding protein [Bacilli bacterium]